MRALIRGIIFDFDGTLLNSLRARISAWRRAFEDYGVEVSEETLLPLIGLPGLSLAKKFYHDPEAIEKREEEYFSSMLPDLSLFGDVSSTLSKLEERGIDYVVVTSSRREMMSEFDANFSSIITIDDVDIGKPNIEPYLRAMEIMGVKSSELMVVGDSESDIIPASKINATAVMVKHGVPRESKYADYYIDEISEVIDLIDIIEKKLL